MTKTSLEKSNVQLKTFKAVFLDVPGITAVPYYASLDTSVFNQSVFMISLNFSNYVIVNSDHLETCNICPTKKKWKILKVICQQDNFTCSPISTRIWRKKNEEEQGLTTHSLLIWEWFFYIRKLSEIFVLNTNRNNV